MSHFDINRVKNLNKDEVMLAMKTGQRFVLDPRVPWKLKAVMAVGFIAGAFLYLWLPIDLIPDAIPIIGTADDSAPFVALAIFSAKKWISERGLKMAYNQAMRIMESGELPRNEQPPPGR